VVAYLVEAYVSPATDGDLSALAEKLSEAARAAARAGVAIRYLRSTLVPADQTCFHYIEAPSSSLVEDFLTRAQVQFDRILEVRDAAATANHQTKEGQ
jgi:hypothetical protein